MLCVEQQKAVEKQRRTKIKIRTLYVSLLCVLQNKLKNTKRQKLEPRKKSLCSALILFFYVQDTRVTD